MESSIQMHHKAIRRVISDHEAYEVKTIGDSFMIATHDADTAVRIACEIQEKLVDLPWPDEILTDPTACAIHDNDDNRSESSSQSGRAHGPDRWLYRGLRVRIGIHSGSAEVVWDEVAKGYDYYGATVNIAARTEAVTHGGQIVVTEVTYGMMSDEVKRGVVVTALGGVNLKGIKDPVPLVEITPRSLQGRSFDVSLLVQQVESTPLCPNTPLRQSTLQQSASFEKSMGISTDNLLHSDESKMTPVELYHYVRQLRALYFDSDIKEFAQDDE